MFTKKIETGIHYPIPIHKQPGYINLIKIRSGFLKNTEKFSNKILSLPMHPWLTKKEVNIITTHIENFFQKKY